MGIADRIAAAAVAACEVEYPAGSGLRWRLRPLVAGDLLSKHIALLAAVVPPDQGDRLTLAAIEEATGEDRAKLAAAWSREVRQRAADPDLQAQAWQHAVAVVCASVVGADDGGGWEPIQIVPTEAERDLPAGRLHLSDLPVGAIQFLSGVARTYSFGGEAARERLARFRGQRPAADARPDGPHVG